MPAVAAAVLLLLCKMHVFSPRGSKIVKRKASQFQTNNGNGLFDAVFVFEIFGAVSQSLHRLSVLSRLSRSHINPLNNIVLYDKTH